VKRNAEAKTYQYYGAFFQLPMIFVWGFRGILFSLLAGEFSWSLFPDTDHTVASKGAFVLSMGGLGLMVLCMMRIYRPSKTKEKPPLITSDVFAVTRHPMYHGMFIADAALFFTSDLTSFAFWVTWVIFVGLLLAAGYFQEKEVLANWGEEAKRYYARTPRFVFEWIWFWAQRPKSV